MSAALWTLTPLVAVAVLAAGAVVVEAIRSHRRRRAAREAAKTPERAP